MPAKLNGLESSVMARPNYTRGPVAGDRCEHAGKFSQGAIALAQGVQYRTWSEHEAGELIIYGPLGEIRRTIRLTAQADNFWTAVDELGQPGDLYRYRFGNFDPWPDPASRFQPTGIHAPSMVVDGKSFGWTD